MKIKRMIAFLTVCTLLTGLITLPVFADGESTNLLTDGDFDSVSFTALDWEFKTENIWYSGGNIVTDEDTENSYADVSGAGIAQSVTVTQGKTYILSADIKTTSSSGIALEIYNNTQKWPVNTSYLLASVTTDVSDDWQTVSLEYTATDVYNLCIYTCDWSGTTYIDNVSLVEKTITEYSVTLNTKGGTIANADSYASYTVGTGLTLPSADEITRSGYTFNGWYDNMNFTGEAVAEITAEDIGDKNYWAKWIGDNADADNLLTDGSFETGYFSDLDWTFKTYNVWYSGGEMKQDDDGSFYASITDTGIGQNVAVSPLKSYTLTAKIRTTGTVSLCIQNGDTAYPGQQPASTLASVDCTGEEWRTVTLNYDAGNIGHLFIYLWSGDGITTDIDDVRLICNGEITAGVIDSTQYTAGDIFDANAGNPIIPGYIGDPFLFKDDDGTFYVYGTTDGYGESAGDIMAPGPYCVWYSKDLTNWKCRTFEYEDGTFPKTSEVLWAPSVTKASNGKYYMAYIWQAYNCYLAEADSPLGPWSDALDGEVVAENMFDTDIVTIDGVTYVVTQGPQTNNKNTVYLGKFKEDMSGLDGELQPIFNENVFEAPGLFKKDGKYYLTFANGSLGNGTYRVDYAISDSIDGTYTYQGTILQRYGDIHTTGHSNCIEINGDWYICYHRKVLDGNYSYARQAALEKMSFNEDGTIAVMQPSVNPQRPEIENTVADVNLAWQGVTMSASSTGDESGLGSFTCLPMYAADRNNGTLWTAATSEGEQWLMMDLGEEKSVGRIETYFEYHTLAYSYKIEYSTDGEVWMEFADKTDNESLDSPQVDSVKTAVNARYLKITFPDGGTELTSIIKKISEDEGGEHTVTYETMTRTVPVGVFEMNVYSETEKYSVTLNTNGGEINGEGVASYRYGNVTQLPTDVTKTGYTFVGWYDNAEFTGEAVTEIAADSTGNKEYFARWSSNEKCIKITAEYDENGILEKVVTEEFSVEDITQTENTATLKTFYWKTLAGMQPVR